MDESKNQILNQSISVIKLTDCVTFLNIIYFDKKKEEIIKAKQFWIEKKANSAKNVWKIVNDITGRSNKNVSVLNLLNSTNYTSYEDLANAINLYFSDKFQISTDCPETKPSY